MIRNSVACVSLFFLKFSQLSLSVILSLFHIIPLTSGFRYPACRRLLLCTGVTSWFPQLPV